MKPPQPDPGWSPEVQRLYEHDRREMWDRTQALHVWNQYHAQLDVYFGIVERLRPASVLDVGCAQATLALLLAEKGYCVVANDLRPEFLEYARSRYERGDIRFVCGNVFDLRLDERFDLVFANQIIEHLVYPVEFLGRLRDLAKPGGHLVVTTPNHAYVRNRLPTHRQLGDPARYADRQFSADADGHFFAYTVAELTEYARQAGLADVRPFFFETPWVSGHVKVRYLHPLLPSSALGGLDRLTRSLPWAGERLCHQLGIVGRTPC